MLAYKFDSSLIGNPSPSLFIRNILGYPIYYTVDPKRAYDIESPYRSVPKNITCPRNFFISFSSDSVIHFKLNCKNLL